MARPSTYSKRLRDFSLTASNSTRLSSKIQRDWSNSNYLYKTKLFDFIILIQIINKHDIRHN